MKVVRNQDLTLEAIARMGETEKLHVYNALDCCVTFEVRDAIVPALDNITRSVYEFEKDLMGPVLEMDLRGVRVDMFERGRVIHSLTKKLNVLESSLNEIIAEGVGVPGLNWRSPEQLKYLFYEVMCIPPVRQKGKITVNRDALEKLKQYFFAQPIVSHLLAMRDIAKKISTLKTEVDADERMRTSYNIAGTETGRFSSSLSAFGTGCVRPSAEALTECGWRSLSVLKDGDKIAQWEKDGSITFVPATFLRKSFSGNLLQCKTEQVSLAVTPAHRVVHLDSRLQHLHVTAACEVAKLSQTVLPLGGTYIGGSIDYPPYLAMLMADFSKEDNAWRGEFKKQRKIDRFLKLADEYGLTFTENKTRVGYRRFRLPGLQHFPKKWGPWVLSLTRDSAAKLLEEARHWDSHDRGSGFIFFSADKEQAEWFATLAHLCGRAATIRCTKQGSDSYSTTLMWAVNVKARGHARVMRKHWSAIPYEGEICCPSVPSSFWLVRENNFISVTGNTNLQNITDELRNIFISDPGMKLAYIDLEQAESRLVGAIIWNLFEDPRYLDACESGDLHTTVCKMAWPERPWTGDLKKDKEIAEEKFYRQFSYRDMAKRLGHGSNYGGLPATMAKHTKVPQNVVAQFQNAYFSAFPGIPRWHQWVKNELLQTGRLINLTGRRRHFFGRRDDPATQREAIAYDPQGSVGDILNTGMLHVWQLGICQLLMQIHDAIVVQYPEDQEQTILPQVLKAIEVPVELRGGRRLVIPSEAKTGWNWSRYCCGQRKPECGKCDLPSNPNGLKKFKEGKEDDRRKVRVDLMDRPLS